MWLYLFKKNNEGCHLSGNYSYTIFDGFLHKKNEKYDLETSTHLTLGVMKKNLYLYWLRYNYKMSKETGQCSFLALSADPKPNN